MTASVSTPNDGRSGLVRAARLSRITASGAFAAFSLFLLLEVGLDSLGSVEPAAPPPRALPTEAARPAGPPLLPEAKAVSSATAEEQPLPPLRPRQILIDLGPPRSEVFVDGHSVGRSPFVGQVKCRPGREISIVVIPERGLPLQEQRVCPH